MKVMVVGSGGREHALVWKLLQSPRVTEILAVPGNAGVAQLARCVACDLTPAALLALAEQENVEFTVVGPEAPLVAGVVDVFEAGGRRIFGPNRAASRLEGSKVFSKAFMARYNIPSADYRSFSNLGAALTYLETQPLPVVVKDSALAAGKGVTVAQTYAEAAAALGAVLSGSGRSGGEVVVEAFLSGQEVSLLLLTDGDTVRLLPLAQDYKQAFEGDTGSMTGGMGAVAPVPLLSEAQLAEVVETVVAPTLAGLRAEGVRYRGVLFIGLMVGEAGVEENGVKVLEYRVLEYNVRFGDPETQAVLPLLESDLLELLEATAEGRLHEVTPRWSGAASACVVLAAPGYPGAYTQGTPITIPDDLGALVFHAGTALQGGELVSAGGRVLSVVALAASLQAAVAAAYGGVDRIGFEGAHVRRDIGGRLQDDSSSPASLPEPLEPARGDVR